MTSEIRVNKLTNRVGLGTVEYTNTGIVVSGISTSDNFKTGTSNLHSTGLNIFDLDVDGHTNLDNVNIAGVTTTTGNIHLNSTDKKIYLTSDYDQYITANAASNYMVFAAGNQERLRITSSGNVGIGTDNPSHKLDISDDGVAFPNAAGSTLLRLRDSGSTATLSIDAASNAISAIQFGDTDAASVGSILYNHVSNHLQFNTGGTGEKLRIASDGVITAQKSATFGNTSDSFTAVQITSSTSGISELRFGDTTANAGYVKYEHSNNALILATNATERFRIASDGKFLYGISTARSGFFNTASQFNPHFQIEGAGDADDPGRVTSIIYNSTTTAGPTLLFGKTSTGSVGGTGAVANNHGLGLITFQGMVGGQFTQGATISASVSGTPGDNDLPTHLSFGTCADGAASATERLRIDSSGNVTVKSSTSNQQPKLRVESYGEYGEIKADGNGSIILDADPDFNSADSLIVFKVDGGEKARITSAGVVGITTDASGNGSGAKLVVGGRVQSNNGGYWFADANGAENGWHVQDSGGNLTIVESGVAERVRITSTGEVLIGATARGREKGLHLAGADQDPNGAWTQMGIYSTDAQASNKGGSIGFGGQDGSVAKQQFAAIKGAKENGTSGNYAGYLAFYTRPAGAVTAERLRITSGGKVFIGADSTDFSDAGTFFNIKNDAYGGRIGFSNNTATAGVPLMEQLAYWGTNKVAGTVISAGTDTTNKDDAYMRFYTNSGSGMTERLRITSQGSVFVKSDGTVPVNQAEAGHYGGYNYSAGHAMGLMVKRAIHVSDSAYKGQGGMFLSHSRHVACNGTTYNMFTIHNREGCLIGDVYVGFSASGSAAVRHYKFHCYYGASTLTDVNNPGGRASGDSISANISSSNDAHFFQVIPNQNANGTHTVTMTIIGQSSGTFAGHYYTVSYN